MPRKPELETLRAEVWSELKAGNGVTEAYLIDKTHFLDGYCEGRMVYVNPAPAVVETAIHELIHRVRPRWGERRVWREARRVIASLNDRELRAWYRQYQRVAVKRQSPVRIEDDEDAA